MNIEQLRYLVEIAKYGSLTEASRNLHITQSGISQAVTQFEKELGVRLFIRSRSGASLTLEGKRIVEKALNILNEIEDLREIAATSKNLSDKNLRIVVAPGIMPVLVKALLDFKRKYPTVSVEVNEMTSRQVITSLEQNTIDLGLIPEEEMPAAKKDYRFIPVLTGKIVAFVNKKNPLARKKKVNPEELKNCLFVLYDEGFVDRFMQRFVETFGPINVFFKTRNYAALAYALRHGSAATIGYDYPPGIIESEDIVSLEIAGLPNFPLRFGWVYSTRNKLSGIAEHFMNTFAIEARI